MTLLKLVLIAAYIAEVLPFAVALPVINARNREMVHAPSQTFRDDDVNGRPWNNVADTESIQGASNDIVGQVFMPTGTQIAPGNIDLLMNDCDKIFSAINLGENSTLETRIKQQIMNPWAGLNQDKPSARTNSPLDFATFVEECFKQRACVLWDMKSYQVLPERVILDDDFKLCSPTAAPIQVTELVGVVEGVGLMVGSAFAGSQAMPIFLRHSGIFAAFDNN